MGYILTNGTEPDILDTIRFIAMARGPHQVVVAQSAFEMLQQARRDSPRLAVWDLAPSDRLASSHFEQWHADSTLGLVPLVVLTSAGSTATYMPPTSPANGATCLVKPVDPIEFGLRLGTLLNSETESSSPPPAGYQRQIGDLVLDYHLFQVRTSDKTTSLTPTEFKLLRYFVENPGQTFSSEQLLDEVWKYPPGVGSPDVVRMYVKRLRDKIELDPRKPQHIVTIPGHGYQMARPAPAPVPAPAQASETSGQCADGRLSTRQINGMTDQYRAGTMPSTSTDGTLQEILLALQTVTRTCQTTLAMTAYLVDELSRRGAREQGGQGDGGLALAPPPTSAPMHLCTNESSPPADEITVAAQSLSGLAEDLQATLTQLQAGWPGAVS
ncbi:MAG: winged-helix domain-containing protein [Anaerolineae bacterium]